MKDDIILLLQEQCSYTEGQKSKKIDYVYASLETLTWHNGFHDVYK